MSRSNSRNLSDIANPNNNLISVSNNDVTITGAGVTQYDSAQLLPTSGVITGTQAYVAATGKLYIRGDGGWYNIATVNQSPTMTSVLDSGGASGPFTLATDGSVTRITTTATDPEGFPITFTATPNSDFNNMASVSIDSTGGRIFTITPLSEDSATTTSGTITFKASDGVNIASSVQTFTLTFVSQIENTRSTSILLKASGNNKQNTFTDASATGHSVTVTGSPIGVSYSPHHIRGYSKYFDAGSQTIELQDDANTNPGNKNFTVEAWIMPTVADQENNATIICRADSTSARQFALYMNEDTLGFKIWDSSDTEKACTFTLSNLFQVSKWYHVAGELSGAVGDRTMNLYLDGRRVATTTGSIGSTYVRDSNNYFLEIGQGRWESNTTFAGYMRDVRLTFNSSTSGQTPKYGGADFNIPTDKLQKDSNTQLLVLNGEGFLIDKSDNTCNVYTKTQYTSNSTDIAFFQIISPYDVEEYTPSSHGTSWNTIKNNYLRVAYDSSTLEIGTNSFCMEAWVYPTKFSQYYSVVAAKWSGNGYVFGFKSTGPFGYLGFTSGSNLISFNHTSAKVHAGEWNHIAYAFERTGATSATLRTFVNGVLAGSNSTSETTVQEAGSNIDIGRWSGDYATWGLMSDFRFTVGSAVYTSAFSPPTAPLTTNSNVKLLVNSDLGIYDAAGGGIGYLKAYNMIYGSYPFDTSLIIEGNAKSSTTQTKNATSSMYFDGTGDRVTLANITADGTESLGYYSWALSMWVRPDNTDSGERVIVHQGDKGSNGWGLVQSGTSLLYYTGGGSSADITVSSAFSAQTWVHIALEKTNAPFAGETGAVTSAANTQIFVNGAGENYTTSSGYISDNASTRMEIGGSTNITNGWGSDTGYIGYIEDLKIVNKHNEPTFIESPFVISNKTSTSDSNTFLLCAHASAYDTVSGNWTVANGGTPPTVSQFSPVKNGYSLKFDGTTNTRMELTHTGSSSDYMIGDADNDAAANWSVDGWFWTDVDNDDQYFLSNYNDATGNETFMLGTRSSGKFQLRRHTDGSGNQLISSLWKTYKWQHFLFTQEYKSAQGNVYDTLYIDGKVAHSATNSNTYAYDFQTLAIGGRMDSTGSSHWSGYVSNIRIQTGTVIHPGAAVDSSLRYGSFSVPTLQVRA